MFVVLEAITHVFHGGRVIEPGEKFSVDEKMAEKLIKGKSAKKVDSLEVNNQNQQNANDTSSVDINKELEKITKEKLVQVANEVGLALSESLKKAEIIYEIIQQGKAEEVLNYESADTNTDNNANSSDTETNQEDDQNGQ